MADQDSPRRPEVAARVRYWIERRGMTREVFAGLMGKSVSWVDKIRSGDRALDRLPVLRQISDVLDVPLSALIDEETAERAQTCPDSAEIDAIREALQQYDIITHVFRSEEESPQVPNLTRLEQGLRYGWAAFQSSNYKTVGMLLPGLLRAAQGAVSSFDGTDNYPALRLLTQVYQLTAATSFKLGQGELGWIAADRGIQAAEEAGDPTLIGATARRVAHALSATHQGDRAVELVLSATSRLAPELPAGSPAFLSAYGMLYLKGSIAAARIGRPSVVRDLQREAMGVARRLGADHNEQWSAFGPTNVLLHRVAALADMREGGRVIEAAEHIDPEALQALPRERRANHLLNRARGYMQWGKRGEAVTAMLDADMLATEEVRCRPATRILVLSIVRSYPRGAAPPAPFLTLARRLGVHA